MMLMNNNGFDLCTIVVPGEGIEQIGMVGIFHKKWAWSKFLPMTRPESNFDKNRCEQ